MGTDPADLTTCIAAIRSVAIVDRMIGPLDLFDTLVATDWSGRFESLTDEETRRLELYDSLAHELGRRSFFQAEQRLTFGKETGGAYRLEHAGEDSFRSMALTFRQLVMNGEPAEFGSVRAMLRARAVATQRGNDAITLLDVLGSRYREAQRKEMMRSVYDDDPLGDPIEILRARRVVDDWFYSGVVHTDADKTARVRGWSSAAYEWAVIEAIHGISAVLWEMHIVVAGLLASRAPVST